MAEENQNENGNGVDSKFSSRKFIIAIAGALLMLALAKLECIAWKVASDNIVWVLGFYMIGNGLSAKSLKQFEDFLKIMGKAKVDG